MEPSADLKPPAKRFFRLFMWGVLVTLLLVLLGFALAVYYISSPAVIEKIHQTVKEQAGVEFDFKTIELNGFPLPGVTLHEVSFAIPDRGQGKVAAIRLAPAILPLLVGDLRLRRISLEAPEFSLDLPDSLSQAAVRQNGGLEVSLTEGFALLAKLSVDFVLVVNKGHFHIGRGQPLAEVENMDLYLTSQVTDANTARASLIGEAAVLWVSRDGRQEKFKGAELDGSLSVTGDTVSMEIKQLALDEPRLELEGKIERASAIPAVTLDVSGRHIDVDATRRAALALAGDVTFVSEIFKYLRGGTISQLTVMSQAQKLADLGDLSNLHIEGRMQKGNVSIPEIKLELTETDGHVQVADGILRGTGMSTRLEGSTGHDGTLQVGLADGNDLFRMELMLSADLHQAKQVLERIVVNKEFIEEVNRITRLQGAGTGKLTLGDSLNNLNATVDVTALDFNADYQRIPFPVTVTGGRVKFAKNLIKLQGWQGTLGDSQFSELSCLVELSSDANGFSQGLDRIELGLDGNLEKDFVDWLSKTISLPQLSAVRAPVKLSEARISWQENAKTTFNGGLSIKGGPDLVIGAAWQPGKLSVHTLKLKDQYSDADLSLDYAMGLAALRFSGALQHETVNALFAGQDYGKGRVAGDFALKGYQAGLKGVVVTGQLNGSNLAYPLPSGDEIAIAQAELTGDGNQVDVDLSKLSWQNMTWDPVRATVDFSQDKPHVRVAKADLCGINAPGVWTIDGKSIALNVTLHGENLDVTTVSRCVEREQVVMTGTFSLSGQIHAQGLVNELIKGLQGTLDVTFSDGLIKQDKTLARVLEVLNVSEIVKGRLPDLSSEAFVYKTIEMQGEFQGGKLLVTKLSMVGETLDLLGQGEIDLAQGTIDIELLAAPLKTVDTVIKNIPGVNYLMAGSLVAIPVSIVGPLEDPKVEVLSASAIGSSLLRLGERTIKSPLKLIEKFKPQGNGQHN